MKKLYSFILLFSGIITASAQTYRPFPSSSAIWTQRHGNGEADPSFSVYGLKTDDTVVNGVTYHKLYHSPDAVLDASEYCGGLREDATKRVYFYDATTQHERLLYDFSVVAGDTVKYGLINGPAAVVDYVDSVNIAGTFHRRINFRQLSGGSTWTEGAWIEGIGNSSLGGLLGSAMAQPTCDCAANTVCFSSGNVTYHNPAYANLDCTSILNTEVVHSTRTLVTLSPNPLAGTGILHIGGQIAYNKITVLNLQGRLMLSENISGKGDVALNGSDYLPGIYIYMLQNEYGETATGKFVVY